MLKMQKNKTAGEKKMNKEILLRQKLDEFFDTTLNHPKLGVFLAKDKELWALVEVILALREIDEK